MTLTGVSLSWEPPERRKTKSMTELAGVELPQRPHKQVGVARRRRRLRTGVVCARSGSTFVAMAVESLLHRFYLHWSCRLRVFGCGLSGSTCAAMAVGSVLHSLSHARSTRHIQLSFLAPSSRLGTAAATPEQRCRPTGGMN